MRRSKPNLVKFDMFLLRACPLPGSRIRAWQIQKLETPDIFVSRRDSAVAKMTQPGEPRRGCSNLPRLLRRLPQRQWLDLSHRQGHEKVAAGSRCNLSLWTGVEERANSSL